MRNPLFFEIPSQIETMAGLVSTIPPDWRWMSGKLVAPDTLISEGRVEKDTGFFLEQNYYYRPTIRGKGNATPNLHAILVEGKLPGFIVINSPAGSADFIDLKTNKRIASGFLLKGYQGSLVFHHSEFHDTLRFLASCFMQFKPWIGGGTEEGPQPARVRIQWDLEIDGNESLVHPIIKTCFELNLKEYTPTRK